MASSAPQKTKHGRGRPKGSKNKRTLELERILKLETKAGDTPLEVFLRIMRSDKYPFAVRIDMAKAAAPYMHPRLMPLMSAPTRRADHTAADIRAVLAAMREKTIVAAPPQRTQLVKGKQ